MATYKITTNTDPNSGIESFKYRHRSSKGFRTAQAEFDRRRDAGQFAVMWRWGGGKVIEVERCGEVRTADGV